MDILSEEAAKSGFRMYEEYSNSIPFYEEGIWYDSDESEHFSVFVPNEELALYKKVKAIFNHQTEKWELQFQAYVPGYGYGSFHFVEDRDSLSSALRGAKEQYESFYFFD